MSIVDIILDVLGYNITDAAIETSTAKNLNFRNKVFAFIGIVVAIAVIAAIAIVLGIIFG